MVADARLPLIGPARLLDLSPFLELLLDSSSKIAAPVKQSSVNPNLHIGRIRRAWLQQLAQYLEVLAEAIFCKSQAMSHWNRKLDVVLRCILISTKDVIHALDWHSFE